MRRFALLLVPPLALAINAPSSFAQQEVAATSAADVVPDTVQITLVDFDIQMPDTLAAGAYVFHILNEGGVPHSLEIERDGEHHRTQDPVVPGAAVRLELEISPGLYTVFCPVGDHQYERSMERPLVVTARL